VAAGAAESEAWIARVQECQIEVIHALCELVDDALLPGAV
jgi:hypothetical protein